MDVAERYTREQKKIVKAMQGGALIWVAYGYPFLTDLNQSRDSATVKLNRKTFNSLMERDLLEAGKADVSNGIAKTTYTLTKKGIAVKCQR